MTVHDTQRADAPPPTGPPATYLAPPIAETERSWQHGEELDEVLRAYSSRAQAIETEIGHRIVGQRQVVRNVLIALVCEGHVLLEGVPGLGKTELLKSLAQAVDLEFSRIQFTPDLMPADVVGTQVLEQDDKGHRRFVFQEGPVFTNLLLADEINRATPKSQSALLEAMQEKTVTVGGLTRPLPRPFLVMATQNPIELEGTYPLPEAQLDRFLLKVDVPSPPPDVLAEILRRTTGVTRTQTNKVASEADLAWMIDVTRRVPVASHLYNYAALLVANTHPDCASAPAAVKQYLRAGASPRGGQAMILTAKARALLDGRPNVSVRDIMDSAASCLRHRVMLGYEASADRVGVDEIIAAVVQGTQQPIVDIRGTS